MVFLLNLERRLRVYVRLGGFPMREHVPMNREELYLSYAADCQQMAYVTRNEHERLIWLDMAQSWLQLAQVVLPRWNLSLINLVAMRRRLSRGLVGCSRH